MAISEAKAMFIVMNFIQENGGTDAFFEWNWYTISGEYDGHGLKFSVTALESEESLDEYDDEYGRQNADYWKIYKFDIDGHTFFIRFSGSYTSHVGAKFESMDLVQPVPVAKTIYRPV